MNNRKVRSLMRKPKYGRYGSAAWTITPRYWMWIMDEWRGYRETVVSKQRNQLLHKGKKP